LRYLKTTIGHFIRFLICYAVMVTFKNISIFYFHEIIRLFSHNIYIPIPIIVNIV
jgi:hypothetical protein